MKFILPARKGPGNLRSGDLRYTAKYHSTTDTIELSNPDGSKPTQEATEMEPPILQRLEILRYKPQCLVNED